MCNYFMENFHQLYDSVELRGIHNQTNRIAEFIANREKILPR